MTDHIPADKKVDELYELIEKMNIAMFTTRRPDGTLVSRPMSTQERDPVSDLWFMTNIETHKNDDLDFDSNINLGYYDDGSKEWVSVSGTATVSQDRALIKRLYKKDWGIWLEDQGGDRNGGPEDPRIALILVDAQSVHYMKSKYSKPRVLFEFAKRAVTGKEPQLGREEQVSGSELDRAR